MPYSGSMTANVIDSNTLSIVGVGDSSNMRRINMYSEGGMTNG